MRESSRINHIVHDLIEKTDLCVKCGLCLPHCPTYNKTQNENESPRGRIALIQAWANKELTGSAKLQSHIDNCLLCRSCENVCPAQVPYGQIIDDFRSTIPSTKKSSLDLTLLKNIAHNKKLSHVAESLLKNYQSSALQRITRFLKLPKIFKLDKAERLVSDKPGANRLCKLKNYYPAKSDLKDDVALFSGCMGSLLDMETLHSAISLLNHAGFNVHIPGDQTCCGALDLHNGDKETADQLEDINQQAFGHKEWKAIISIASGCGSQLQAYKNTGIARKTRDISQFLINQGISFTSVAPLNSTVLLHTPCSLKNIMHEEQGAFNLLKQIPGIKITTITNNIKCCGSAGSYMLQHAEMAELLVDDLIDEVISYKQKPDYLVTSNIGCALHISARLTERHVELEVVHPVTLIARQLSQ